MIVTTVMPAHIHTKDILQRPVIELAYLIQVDKIFCTSAFFRVLLKELASQHEILYGHDVPVCFVLTATVSVIYARLGN